MSSVEHGVLIAGGGPSGLVAARTLASAGVPVTVVDAGRVQGARVIESLAPASRRILAELDLMHLVEGHAICPGNLSAWGSAELYAVDFIRGPDGAGWQLDRERFDAALLAATVAAGARVLFETRVLDARRDGDSWLVSVADSSGTRQLRCRFLVDATGRRARLCRIAGCARIIRDHEQVAFVATYATASERDGRTLVESVRDGWWYSSAGPGDRRVVGFITLAASARGELRTPAGFEHHLATTLHVSALHHAGSRILVGPQATDASSTHLEPPAGPGWIAVGDAAIAFDPLSSQGLFHALYTGMKGARAILTDDHALYISRLASIHASYLRTRAALFARERRWPDAPFWQ